VGWIGAALEGGGSGNAAKRLAPRTHAHSCAAAFLLSAQCREVRIPNAELVAQYGVQLLQNYKRSLAEDECELLSCLTEERGRTIFGRGGTHQGTHPGALHQRWAQNFMNEEA
jgi:hypothetical protein